MVNCGEERTLCGKRNQNSIILGTRGLVAILKDRPNRDEVSKGIYTKKEIFEFMGA